jgi:L-methionine (R)-S-oxide reductase
MAESILDVRGLAKADAYAAVADSVDRLLAGTTDHVTAMATIGAVLHHGFGFLWTGFYRVVSPTLLRVGPYQGTVGCLEITIGRGVCGTAAAERQTVIVPDVDAFPGHITCDVRSRSEIVVPVFDRENTLIAVLDIDSDQPATFDADDQRGLERIVAWFARSGQ